MFRRLVPMLSLSTLALAAVATFGAAPASAQQFDAGPPPPYVVGAPDPTFMGRNHVRGFVRAFDHFNMTLGIHHQGVPVQLHQGTVIRPLGLTIQPGMFLRVDGYFSGGVFYADRIVLMR
jgi:invasion protein IalB